MFIIGVVRCAQIHNEGVAQADLCSFQYLRLICGDFPDTLQAVSFSLFDSLSLALSPSLSLSHSIHLCLTLGYQQSKCQREKAVSGTNE